jgi:hypothetical protein
MATKDKGKKEVKKGKAKVKEEKWVPPWASPAKKDKK